MPRFNLLFGGFLSCLLSSCIIDANDNEKVSPFRQEVSFLSNITTKGFLLTEERLESMGVFAYNTEANRFELGAKYTEEMMNQRIIRSELEDGMADWRYTPVQLWPQHEDYKLSFFAYTPYASVDNGISFEETEPGALPVLTYEVPHWVEQQPDLCVAIPQTNLTRRNPDVDFSFKHVLSCVSFFIEGAGAKVKGVAITGIKTKGELSLGLESEGRVGSNYDYMIRWKLDEAISERDYSAGLMLDEDKDYLTSTKEIKNILSEDGYLMMLPQTLTSQAKIVLTLADGSQKEFPLRMMTDRWQAGVRYQYKLKWRGAAN